MTESHLRFDDLAETLQTAPLNEIADIAIREAGSAQRALAVAFADVPRRFRPERAGRKQGVFLLEIDTGGGIEKYLIAVADGHCRVSREEDANPDVTMRMSFADLLRLVTGRMSGQDAFMTGKVAVSGDLIFAMRWGDWFGRS